MNEENKIDLQYQTAIGSNRIIFSATPVAANQRIYISIEKNGSTTHNTAPPSTSIIVDANFVANDLLKLKIWIPATASWGYYDITIIRSEIVAAGGGTQAMPDNIFTSVVISDI